MKGHYIPIGSGLVYGRQPDVQEQYTTARNGKRQLIRRTASPKGCFSGRRVPMIRRIHNKSLNKSCVFILLPVYLTSTDRVSFTSDRPTKTKRGQIKHVSADFVQAGFFSVPILIFGKGSVTHSTRWGRSRACSSKALSAGVGSLCRRSS